MSKANTLIIFGFLSFFCNYTYAHLMITPSRVVFDEKTRSAEVTLLNNSDTTKIYRIDWEEKMQTPDGQYKNLAKGEYQFSASQFIQHSPRQVTIKPGEYQKIKLRAKPSNDLTVGEYRSHLYMKSINDVKDSDEFKNRQKHNGKGQTLMLIPKISFSIPIIIRKGKNNSSASITAIQLEAGDGNALSHINVKIDHSGEFSSFGSLYAYMKVGNGPVEQIGEAHNIALFRESNQRISNIVLQNTNIPKGAVVQVLYKGDDEYDGEILGKAAIRYE